MIEPTPVVWLMGPTSAGKTTLASALSDRLRTQWDLPVVHWDGDQVREMLGETLDFSPQSRLHVVRTLAVLAFSTSQAGVLTVVSALTAHDDARRLIRKRLPRLLIVFVKCPVETCMERDPKGLYRQAAAGKIDTLIGYNSNYTPPPTPDLELDTSSETVEVCVQRLADFLGGHKLLPNRQAMNAK